MSKFEAVYLPDDHPDFISPIFDSEYEAWDYIKTYHCCPACQKKWASIGCPCQAKWFVEQVDDLTDREAELITHVRDKTTKDLDRISWMILGDSCEAVFEALKKPKEAGFKTSVKYILCGYRLANYLENDYVDNQRKIYEMKRDINHTRKLIDFYIYKHSTPDLLKPFNEEKYREDFRKDLATGESQYFGMKLVPHDFDASYLVLDTDFPIVRVVDNIENHYQNGKFTHSIGAVICPDARSA